MRRTTAITRKMEAMLHNLTGHIAAAVGLIALTLAFSTPVPAQSGAIFTTDANGATVNGNIYQSKADVYLDGGPPPTAPCTSARATTSAWGSRWRARSAGWRSRRSWPASRGSVRR